MKAQRKKIITVPRLRAEWQCENCGVRHANEIDWDENSPIPDVKFLHENLQTRPCPRCNGENLEFNRADVVFRRREIDDEESP